MQPKLAVALQLAALSCAALTLQSEGCAAGTTDDDVPTGPVVASSTSDGGPSASGTTVSSTKSSASTTVTASSSSTSSVGGAGGESSSSSTSNSTASDSSASTGGGGAGGCAGYSHTIAIDGTNDFVSGEIFTTSSMGYTGFISWDATYVYLGMQGPDVASASSTKWLTAYFGGAGGTTSGVAYNTQSPTLPFSSKWHVRWKTDNTFTNALVWNGSAWVDAGWSFTGNLTQTGNYVELRVARTDIGNPTTLYLDLDMLNEQDLAEASYAAVPFNAFSDGYDPNFSHHFAFDLTSCDEPSSYVPL